MKRIFPPSFYNPLTLAGAAVAFTSFGLVVFLVVLDLLAGEQKPYMGILTYVLFPAVLLGGLALVAIGIWRVHRREKRGLPAEMQLPRIDLNNPHQRAAFFWFSIVTIMLLVFSAFGSYKAYEYTDSDAFCGEMCHKVMHPEYTAYQDSPHARVGCVKCHIGPGAGPFVQSKEHIRSIQCCSTNIRVRSQRRSKTCDLHRKRVNNVTGRATSSARSVRPSRTTFRTNRTRSGRLTCSCVWAEEALSGVRTESIIA
jgi:hypothetical protein